jgi:two-component system, NtrC family, sensor kinase
MGSQAGSEAPPVPAGAPGGLCTRRRLALAFSCVFASLALAFALLVYTLHRIDRTIDSMEDGDEETELLLELETAVQEQYGLQGQYVASGGARRDQYEGARERTAALLGRLGARAGASEPTAATTALRDAAAELDRVFREAILPAVRAGTATSSLVRDTAHPAVARIQREIDGWQERASASIAAWRADLRAQESAALRRFGGVLLASAAISAGAVLYLSRSVARPLAILTQGAAVLGSGDLGARIGIDTPDEFGSLASDLNALAVSIQDQQTRLVESEQLAGVGRVAAGIAQEINSPLQVMLGHLSRYRGDGDPRLAAVEEETLRCKQIVDGMLELSRPRAHLYLGPVDLRALCEEVSTDLLPLARKAKVRIAVHGAGSALADRLRLRQALFHLVKNAVEAAGYGGRAEVRILESASGPHIRVSDTGPGVPAARAMRIPLAEVPGAR